MCRCSTARDTSMLCVYKYNLYLLQLTPFIDMVYVSFCSGACMFMFNAKYLQVFIFVLSICIIYVFVFKIFVVAISCVALRMLLAWLIYIIYVFVFKIFVVIVNAFS